MVAPYYEDLSVGDVVRSRLGRTVLDVDNVWFTGITHNSNQIHFNAEYARERGFDRLVVDSTFTLALITGLSVEELSERTHANLGWDEVRLTAPVFAGDTLWAESEVLELRESRSHPDTGIVTVRTRGVNQRGETVIEFRRTFMLPKKPTPA
jgi:itaconyl-CoA hydratase